MEDRYRFSRQEERVLVLSITGLDDREIASRLGIGLGTVRTFWKRIRAKCGGETRAEVVASFAESGKGAKPEDTLSPQMRLLSEASAREASEQAFRLLANLVPVSVVTADAAGVVVFGNDTARQLFGFDPVGHKASSLVASEAAAQSLAKGQAHVGDTHLTVSEQPAVCLQSVPLPGASANALLCVFEPKASPCEAMDDLARRALQRARIGQVIIRADSGVIVFANDRIGELLGHPSSELQARRLHDIVAPSDRQRLEQAFQRATTVGGAQCSIDMIHRNGSLSRVFVDSAHLPDADGGAAHFVLTVRRMADSGPLVSPRSSRLG